MSPSREVCWSQCARAVGSTSAASAAKFLCRDVPWLEQAGARGRQVALARGRRVRYEPTDRAWFAALRLSGHQVNPIYERDRISAVDVEVTDAQALAAPPDLESRVNSRPVPGRLDPPTGLGGAEERVEQQTFYAADLGSVDEDDQTP